MINIVRKDTDSVTLKNSQGAYFRIPLEDIQSACDKLQKAKELPVGYVDGRRGECLVGDVEGDVDGIR